MAPSDREVLIDQVGDLSSAKETVLLLAFRSSRLVLLLKWELCMILFSAGGIFASSTSKSGIRIPRIDDEDLKSTTESTISTSLIHSFHKKLWTSIYLSLESYLTTSEHCWRGEFAEYLKSAVAGLSHQSLNNLPHWWWLNFWLTVQTSISDLELVFVSHSSPPVKTGLVLIDENCMDCPRILIQHLENILHHSYNFFHFEIPISFQWAPAKCPDLRLIFFSQ